MVAVTTDWKAASNNLTASRPGDIDTVQKHPIGTVARFRDATYGEGEFIYLLGAASTVAGDAVSYNATTGATTRAAAGNNIPWTIAFATAATVASTWGWYQISGMATANKTKTTSFAAGIALGIDSTALVTTTSSGDELISAWVAVVASATTTTNNGGKIILNINRPHLQGRVT